MDLAIAIITIAAAISLAAMSPGPSFLMVARTALGVSRRSGLAAALGMGIGAALFAILGLLGLRALLAAVPALHLGLKLLGGVYLLYLGFRIFRSATAPLAMDTRGDLAESAPGFWRYFSLGFFTQISNPKTAVVYASIFVSLLPREIPWSLGVGLALLILLIEGGWYALVALGLSAERPRALYISGKTTIDRLTGGVMALLGAKLLSSDY